MIQLEITTTTPKTTQTVKLKAGEVCKVVVNTITDKLFMQINSFTHLTFPNFIPNGNGVFNLSEQDLKGKTLIDGNGNKYLYAEFKIEKDNEYVIPANVSTEDITITELDNSGTSPVFISMTNFIEI